MALDVRTTRMRSEAGSLGMGGPSASGYSATDVSLPHAPRRTSRSAWTSGSSGKDARYTDCHVRTRRLILAIPLLVFAVPVSAQSASSPFDHPVILVGGYYATPTRLSGSAGVLIAPQNPFERDSSPDSSRLGLVFKGAAGAGRFGTPGAGW